MSKREKIILTVMVLAILYGGYEFFYAPSSKTGIKNVAQNEEKLDKFVKDVAVRLKAKDVSQSDKVIIARAKQDWAGDPFLQEELPADSEAKQERAEAPALKVPLTYTGYLQMGPQVLAVINGMEYAVGEELESGGYIVNSISPTQVVIGIKDTDQSIALPVEEMQ